MTTAAEATSAPAASMVEEAEEQPIPCKMVCYLSID